MVRTSIHGNADKIKVELNCVETLNTTDELSQSEAVYHIVFYEYQSISKLFAINSSGNDKSSRNDN